ncbi:RHS repeat-associated core domain-containing protein [Prevotella melaninogenica]|nr:RHS repeat-associated core domain-containing protein [Prevotella melaninogenica]MBW4736099.1 RHS repeat-associated core domain-containing protein [Prevotella melaninogenica]MBW4878751.1 RHS repeat-associated core domain-containing protein [Prevotella melaninogenica]
MKTLLDSNKQGRQSVIVDRIGYDKEGHTVYTKLGNGTETTYTYDKQRERLQVMNLTADGQAVMENRYQYDAVDNILGITNAANPTSLTKLNKAKLGGRSSHTYEYDELNRLIHASGKAKRASYDMVMSFGRMSEPLTKVQKVDSTTTAKSYNFAYKYEDNNHPTAPTQIGHDHYTYDANGNPTLVTNDSANTTREMYWDEDNRLMVLSDNGKTSRYTYNAAGERIMKSYGTMEGVYINGAPQGITFHETDNFTLYPASILSVNKNRFTKHYFLGDKRVASRIGTGLFNNVYGRNGSYVTAGQQDYAERMNQIQKQKETYYKQQGIAPGVPTMKGAYGDPENTGVGYNTVITELGDHSVPEGWIQTPKHNTTEGNEPGAPISWNDPTNPENPQPGYGYVDNDTTKEETFFYHSDHLGSTSYITDSKGNITQYDAYLPYGELLVDEHSSSEDMPYKFNGKEMDAETGLYYYGARYLNPVTCLWYGVDPLAEKYKEIGSYVYCADNPINLFDPDGQKFIYNAQGKFLRKEGKDNLVYIERDGKLTQLIDHGNGMTDEQFNIAAHIVDVESSDAPNESLWIAHAANNAVDDKDVNYAHVRVKGGPRVKNHSLYEQLNDQNYSTTPASARVAYDKDYLTSSTRTTARAGIIDALQSDIDPTHGATLWDGTDFATKGLSHPKFRQYNKITIPDNIRKDYVYRNESYLQRIKSKMQVSPVFERNGIFIHDGKSTAKFSLIATGTFGRTIFWHKK